MVEKEKIEKLIDELDWHHLRSVYHSASGQTHDIGKLKRKLSAAVLFLIKNRLTEFVSDLWLVQWKGDPYKLNEPLKGALKIYFIGWYSETHFRDFKVVVKPKEDLTNKEFKVLQEMLTKALKAENYELCAEIKSRMTSIIEKNE